MSASVRTNRLTVPRLVGIAILLAILGGLLQIFFLLIAMTSAERGLQTPPDDLAALAVQCGGLQRCDFLTIDKVLIQAELLGNFDERPLVIVGHGFRRTRRQSDPLARALLKAGYAVMLFDFRASGESSGKYSTFGATEGNDVAAAIDYAQRALAIPRDRCAYVGFSMGAVAAILHAESLSQLAGAVLVAPYSHLDKTLSARTQRYTLLPLSPWYRPATWAFDKLLAFEVDTVHPVEHIARLAPCPVLLLGGDRDWRAPPQDAYELFDAAREPAEIEILKGYDHQSLESWPDDVIRRVVAFLAQRLPPGVG